MADAIKRTQTIDVSEKKRTSSSSTQWLLENQHATHPICDNNQLQVFICGEDSFKDIAAQIDAAQESIDICCWGFDPGMELVRDSGEMWPRGPTYGDLLIAAGKRTGVTVRLLVWYDVYAVQIDSKNPRNMPGYTHDIEPFRLDLVTEAASKSLSAANSLALAESAAGKYNCRDQLTTEQIHINARRDYCRTWYWAAFKNRLAGVHIRTRAGLSAAVEKSLDAEARRPSGWSIEGAVMDRFGTHHQKPILIDFYHKQGEKAVAYVTGLNSVTGVAGVAVGGRSTVMDKSTGPGFPPVHRDTLAAIHSRLPIRGLHGRWGGPWPAGRSCPLRPDCRTVAQPRMPWLAPGEDP